MPGSVLGRMALLPLLAASVLPSVAWADPATRELEVVGAVPQLRAAPDLDDLVGLPLVSVKVVAAEPEWRQIETLSRVRVGERFTPELARRAADELLDSGRYAEAKAFAQRTSGGGVERASGSGSIRCSGSKSDGKWDAKPNRVPPSSTAKPSKRRKKGAAGI